MCVVSKCILCTIRPYYTQGLRPVSNFGNLSPDLGTIVFLHSLENHLKCVKIGLFATTLGGRGHHRHRGDVQSAMYALVKVQESCPVESICGEQRRKESFLYLQLHTLFTIYMLR